MKERMNWMGIVKDAAIDTQRGLELICQAGESGMRGSEEEGPKYSLLMVLIKYLKENLKPEGIVRREEKLSE